MTCYTAQGCSNPDIFLCRGARTSRAELQVGEWTVTSDQEPAKLTLDLESEEYDSERNKIPTRMRRNPRLIQKARRLWKHEIPRLSQKFSCCKSINELETLYEVFRVCILKQWKESSKTSEHLRCINRSGAGNWRCYPEKDPRHTENQRQLGLPRIEKSTKC